MITRKSLLGLAIASTLCSSAAFVGGDALADTAKDEPAEAAPGAVNGTLLIRTVDEAFSAIREIRRARTAIFDGVPAAAGDLAGQAHDHLVAAKANMDEYSLVTSRKVDEGEAYIPFDTSLALAEGFVPDEARRTAVTRANEHLAKGEQAHAIDALKLGNIDVSLSAALIPVSASVSHLEDAMRLLDEKRYYEANLALKAVEDSVVIETYGLGELPVQGPDPEF